MRLRDALDRLVQWSIKPTTYALIGVFVLVVMTSHYFLLGTDPWWQYVGMVAWGLILLYLGFSRMGKPTVVGDV